MAMNPYAKIGIMFGLIVCLSISMMLMASAEYLPQKQNTAFTLTITSNNGTACNLTAIQYPDGSQALINLPLTKNAQTFYTTIASGNYSQLGTTCHYLSCTDGVNTETGSVCREVQYSGNGIDGSEVTIYVISLMFLVFIAIALGLLAFRINGEDTRGEDGSILSVNLLKHVKPIIWSFIWMIGIACLWIIANMGIAFLPNPLIGNFFFTLFRIAFWVTIIGIPVYFIYLFVKFMESREFQKMIERGVDLRSDYV